MSYKHTLFFSSSESSFNEELFELELKCLDFLQKEKSEGRYLKFTKIFLSDSKNQQQQLMEAGLYRHVLLKGVVSIIEQPPLNGSKMVLLLTTGDRGNDVSFESIRLSNEEAQGKDSYEQTKEIFERYISSLEGAGMTIENNCQRTWIYVRDIDVNYSGVVKARNDVFAKYGMTADTHYIASTGIGGSTEDSSALVAMDFLTVNDFDDVEVKYLQALDHLNPTHEYGVAFERGTAVMTPSYNYYLISGTASIDSKGKCLFHSDVSKQTDRLLDNIEALLNDGGATIADVDFFVVYLRDITDFNVLYNKMKNLFPKKPFVIVQARVCRPEWLVEMECVATKSNSN